MGNEKAPKIAKFIRRLYKIVNDDAYPEIQWTKDGLRFYISDKAEFMRNGLKFLSKTTEFSAFVRLLYVYGFSKSKSIDAFEEEYFHKNFQKNKEQLLLSIKRFADKPTTTLAKDNNTPNQLQDLLQYLNGQNFKLENEVRSLRERVDKQDCTINGLVEILSRMFRNNEGNNNLSMPINNTLNTNIPKNNTNLHTNNRELETYFQQNPNNINSLPFLPAPSNNKKLFESDEEDDFYETEYF